MTAPTSILVSVDDDEYSRFEADRDVVSVYVTVTGASLLNEEITIEFIKARRNRDVSAATKTLTLTSDDSSEYVVTFELNEVVDADDIPKIRRGTYLIRATSTSDTSIVGESEEFLVSLITVERLKNDYLHGTDLRASEVLTVAEQPQIITGVEVYEISKGHPQTWTTLSYTYTDDGNGNIVRTLSWCGGPLVVLTSSKKRYLLRRGESAEYIKVRVSALSMLPTSSASEELLIERKPLDDERLRGIITQSISWVEDSALDLYLEPTIISTTTTETAITYPDGSDIPIFENADWDEIVNAITYRSPTAGHWMNFKMKHVPVLRFDELYGQVANTRIININLNWVEFHEKGGFVELVPFNQEAAFNYIGLVWVESLRGPVPLPNFWNFTAVVGFRHAPPTLIELVAKKAAIDILTIAGQAYRGGFSSQSISRDGISESVSYTASATYGIYSATIEDYRKWIDANLKGFRADFRGSIMVVL